IWSRSLLICASYLSIPRPAGMIFIRQAETASCWSGSPLKAAASCRTPKRLASREREGKRQDKQWLPVPIVLAPNRSRLRLVDPSFFERALNDVALRRVPDEIERIATHQS